ncbi:protein ANTAGONIST OF LIKE HETEROCHROMATIN PROTEIN 1-like [Quercus lobata]|uniref:protein ANTAGONIST OF LIKE HETEROCHROMATIN PROTEIN 1-like n=1 Tax=Quercus lobata TaxID=97700 RepID=UPI001248E7F4|nr:protein ANTAGONIST OF LIKE HETEROCHROMATIN PROTEIN 1-like [Quercus lobata]
MDNPSLPAAIMGAATSVIALGVVLLKGLRSRRIMPREPHVNREYEREIYMNDILCRGDMRCLHHIRMRPIAFYALCKILSGNNLLQETIHMSIKEQVLIFLHTIGHDVRFRVVGGRFYRSVETVHRYFRHVLRAILQLYKHMIREPDKDTPLEIRNSNRFNSYFKDCVGAIDGTHVRASVPIQIQGRFRGRKDGTTQNVLTAANFGLKFTYVLASWEGSAHDSRVLNDALSRPRGLKILEVRRGIISPYRGVRYHLKEFSDNPPRNDKELFNLRHSSLRTSIECCFGVLKKRFRVLDAEPFWSFPTQVDVVLACCIIHNHIIGVDPLDSIMNNGLRGSPLANDSTSRRVQQSQREVQEENREWVQIRDDICRNMWEDYNAME